MPKADPAAALEAVLVAENQALARHDAPAAAALLQQKLAATAALATTAATREQAERLRALAAENRILLERAIDVQKSIITMVARAAQESMARPRYGAEGRTIPPGGALAIARHA
jgi:flagellar biosynthesis/type III secretory pathway chaperone